MVFTKEDCIFIEQLHRCKGFGARKLIKEFLEKGWQVCSVSCLLKKYRESGTTDRKSKRTQKNIDAVGDFVLNQEDAPGTHLTTRLIARETGIHRASIMLIIHRDLHLKCLEKKRAQQLTNLNRLNRLQRLGHLLKKFLVRSGIDFFLMNYFV